MSPFITGILLACGLELLLIGLGRALRPINALPIGKIHRFTDSTGAKHVIHDCGDISWGTIDLQKTARPRTVYR